jgi:hypothetical protein
MLSLEGRRTRAPIVVLLMPRRSEGDRLRRGILLRAGS